ncbi:cAMP-binding protein [Terriglobus roseus DSM 18391]|uniref:cAMP-binding protein n=1 Tax=Terriglobus roseus (strain DSM 18391 / NRRL B-41598 / KBS 63) TaxID=926566 RepID=I3ZLY3_TERRK|nr:Crp/Fnr family transcriptional regulator [Terriglobus roseus]AFL90251.1 cAMP-binding protein [Terriglobus roseus DSM 18391]
MPLRRSCLQCETKGPNCFCSLDRVALGRLESVGHWLRLEAKQEVLREGYAPDHVYVVCSGTLKLTTSSMDGRLLLLRIVGPGDVLGLSAALQRTRYEASAETLELCQLKAIPRTHFLLFMEEFQAVARNSLMAVTREYGSAVLSARRLALSTSAASKLGSVLLDWGGLVLAGEHELMGGSAPNTVSFHMPLTHEELGHMAGISRETVTRTLTALRRDGLLYLENDQMQLRDIARLQQQVG